MSAVVDWIDQLRPDYTGAQLAAFVDGYLSASLFFDTPLEACIEPLYRGTSVLWTAYLDGRSEGALQFKRASK